MRRQRLHVAVHLLVLLPLLEHLRRHSRARRMRGGEGGVHGWLATRALGRSTRSGRDARAGAYLGVHRVRERILRRHLLIELLREQLLRLFEVIRLHLSARTPVVTETAVGQRAALDDLGAERFGESAGRDADRALEVLDDRFGERERLGLRG